jgi:hypothetical protein
MRRIPIPLWLSLVLAVLAAGPALAQTGQINGVVTDNSGAVVPGATVKAVEQATGLPRETVTGADGRYVFTAMRPTSYDITAELQGFQTQQRKGILLQANQNLTVNIALELGTLAETVTVAGESPVVDVTSSTISEVVDSKRIVELPLNGRDAATLSTLVSGMVLTAVDQESGKTIPGALRLSTNGTESRQVSFRLDGTSHTDPYFQQNQPFPFPDALQEFSIQTSNYSAAQGNSAGAVVNAVTRSGTNNLHGGGFGYLRDNTFNARNFFSPTKDLLKRKQYGGYAGGPIQHNKTFFFAGWQGTDITNVGSTLVQFLPTADERNGNFATCGAACNVAIRDPLTGQPFPGNQIPVSRFDPAAVNVLKYLPSVTGDGRVQVPRRIGQMDNQFVTKIDQMVSSKDQVSVRYFFDQFNNDPTYTEGDLSTYRNPTLGSRIRMQNIVGSWTRTISSTLLNETRIGYNRVHSRRYPPDNVPSMKDLGVRLPIYPTLPSISQIRADGYFEIADNLEASFVRPGYEVNNRATWIRGKHNIQFGGELQHYTVTIRNEFRRAGHFTFNGGVTGHPIADFLLGAINTFDQGTGEYKDYIVNYGSLFAQDDFKVSPRLTLNLGLRFESTPPWHEQVGRIEVFTLENYAKNVRSTVFPQAPRGETFRGDPGVPYDGTDAQSSNFGTRLGFAWDVSGDGKTSLRGGGGMFYDQHRDGESGNGAVNAAPWNLRLSVTRPSGPFSDPYRGRTDFDLITDGTIGTQRAIFPTPVLIETLDTVYKTPLTYNFNLTFERELARQLSGRVAYVGSRSVNGRRTVQLNPSVYTPGATTATTDARRIFAADQIGTVLLQKQDRESIYNSLQATISKRYSRGFTVTSNYTLSKVVGNFGDEIIPYTEFNLDERDPLIWGPLTQDRRHRFTTSWVLDLPGGNMDSAMKWVIGGWQWSGVMEYQTGKPFNIISGVDNSRRGIGSTNDRAKLTGQPLEPPAGSDPLLWFNPAAFALNDVGTFGNTPKGYLYGPSLHSWNMGLFKNVPMRGEMKAQFRIEVFNIFNQVNFDIPGTTPNDNRIAVNSANFGRITRTVPGIGDPRIVQLGLKFLF